MADARLAVLARQIAEGERRRMADATALDKAERMQERAEATISGLRKRLRELAVAIETTQASVEIAAEGSPEEAQYQQGVANLYGAQNKTEDRLAAAQERADHAPYVERANALRAALRKHDTQLRQLREKHAAMTRARAQAHAQWGKALAEEIAADLDARSEAIDRLHKQIERGERQMDRMVTTLDDTLEAWPQLAQAMREEHADRLPTLAQEAARRWLALVDYLRAHGRGMPLIVEGRNFATMLPIEQVEINALGPDGGGVIASLSNKLYYLRNVASGGRRASEGEDDGDAEESEEDGW